MFHDISADLYALATSHLRGVSRSGPSNVMAICPFHTRADGSPERSPSFAMSIETGLFLCHSCQARGTLRTFLKMLGVPPDIMQLRYDGLVEAARKNLPPPPDPLKTNVLTASPINEAVLGLLEYRPTQLVNAGFLEDTLRHFEVGFDQWHQRITFPLRDLSGALMGISGRAVHPDQHPRYKVYTDEYRLWHLPPALEPNKRAILWNAHNLYPSVYFSAPNTYRIYVVEGYKAAMWLWQHGYTTVVALSGAYLSWEHQWILERLGAPVVLFLDNNRAGRTGTLRAADVLSKCLDTYIVEYPERLSQDDDAQPDSLSKEELDQALATAPLYLSWLIERGRDPEEKAWHSEKTQTS